MLLFAFVSAELRTYENQFLAGWPALSVVRSDPGSVLHFFEHILDGADKYEIVQVYREGHASKPTSSD